MSLDRYNEAAAKKGRRGLEHRRPDLDLKDSAPRMARKVDLDGCPAGYDPEVWSLALLFEQIGQGYGHILVEGPPIIYAYLERSIEASGYREKYNAPSKHEPQKKKWYWLLEQMIQYWWDDEMDPEHPNAALKSFCNPVEFDWVKYKIDARLLDEKVRAGKAKYRPRTERKVDPEARANRIAQLHARQREKGME